jgi:hypothetical protein
MAWLNRNLDRLAFNWICFTAAHDDYMPVVALGHHSLHPDDAHALSGTLPMAVPLAAATAVGHIQQ